MNERMPLQREQPTDDATHLRLLSVFHFVIAGLALFGIIFLIVHYAIFSAFISNPKLWTNQPSGGPSPAEFFKVFKWFYLVMGVWFAGSGILNVISGFCIRARRHRTFSMFVSGVNCLHLPMGTVLGVFTIIVLVRTSVRELYMA